MMPSRVFGATALAAIVVAGGLGSARPAAAAPLGPAPLSGAPLVQPVAGGCGPGFHPNPWGLCRPNWGPRPGWRRPAFYGGYGEPRPRPFYRPYGYGYGYGPRAFY